ncbi:hypothetical protein SCUCBS95973_007764 [Sporothrix curviconia]|uniref:Thioredoxin domain-containing protein n=1 Tax=Sporothrix curviconia TaxID=1260050 RepID=A0ABP0CHW4_9PEZI
MRIRTAPLLGLLATLQPVSAWKHATDEQLRSSLESSGYTLVAFVQPYATASRALENEWQTIQSAPEGEHVLSFDCSQNAATCRELDAVSTFPTIRLYHRDGRIDRYRGERTAAAIVPFFWRAFRPAAMEVTEQSLVSFMAIDDVVIVAHVHPDDDQLYHRYRGLAHHYRDRYSFGIAFAPPSSPASSTTTRAFRSSVVRCYNNVDDEQHEMSGDDIHRHVGALEAFITQTCAQPLIPELTRRGEYRNEARLAAGAGVAGTAHVKSILHYLTDGGDADKTAFRDSVRPLAKQYRDFVQFAVTDLADYPEMLTAFGLDAHATRGLALQNLATRELFPYRSRTKPITAAAAAGIVEDFLNEIADGNVKPLPRGDQRLKEKSEHDEL